MDVVTEFLENSSIAGVGLIAQTRASRKVFWVCVVISGFTAASMLILQNFENWAENPVITTVETLPITKITFPKVTVCPPPNTQTNLNYDLIKAGNMTLLDDFEGKEQLINVDPKAVRALATAKINSIMHDLFEKILDSEYEQALMLYFVENNKYRNWYNGYSFEENPLDAKKAEKTEAEKREECALWGFICKGTETEQKITTSAPSGFINTPGFRKPFNSSLFINPKSLHHYKIIMDFKYVNVPENGEGTIVFNIDMDLHRKEQVKVCGKPVSESIKINLDVTKSCWKLGWGHYNCVNATNRWEFCHHWNKFELVLMREHFDQEEIDVAMLKTMTGMNVTWNHLQNVAPPDQEQLNKNEKFRKVANAIYANGSIEKLWAEMRQFKIDLMDEFINGKIRANQLAEKISSRLEQIVNRSGIKGDEINTITDTNLQDAAKIFVYLFTVPRDFWLDSVKLLHNSLSTQSLRETLLLMSNLHPKDNFLETSKKIILEHLSSKLEFEFLRIDSGTYLQEVQNNSSVTGIYIMINKHKNCNALMHDIYYARRQETS